MVAERMGQDRVRLGPPALVALATGTTLGNVGGNVMPALLADFGAYFSLSDTIAGLVAAAQLLTTAVVTLLLSARAARPGRVPLARWGLTLAAAGFTCAWLSPSMSVLVCANVVAGAGLGAVFAAGAAALGSAPDVDRATTSTVLAATIATAVLIVAISLAGGGTRGFAVLAVCCLLGLWLIRTLPERPVEHAHERGPALPKLFLAAIAVFGIIEQGAWSYTAVFGERGAGLGDTTISFVLGVAALAALVGVPVGALAARRLGRVLGIVTIGIAEFVAKALVVHPPQGTVFIVAAICWQICYLALLVQILAVAATIDRSGRLVAATAGALALGTGLGPAIVGTILDTVGPMGLALTLFALGITALWPFSRVAARVNTGPIAVRK